MAQLYTLPNCPICMMVKKKLAEKGIPYTEHPFEELPSETTDRAPVLVVEDELHPGYFIYLLSPTEINEWIKAV